VWWHMFINPKKLIKRADKIIAVSHSTKDDLASYYKVPSKKIEVIYNGASDEFGRIDRNNPRLLEVKEKYKLPFNFIFFLGTFEPRKNIIGLVRAYEALREEKNSQLDKYKLVIAGSDGWKSKKIKAEIAKSRYARDILSVKFIDTQDKPFVYNLASIFVYPSFFEGFGLPPLEAMKCGVPVVASNNSSMIEIVGGGGMLVDAYKPAEIALAIKEFLLNKNFAETFEKSRIAQIQKFTWDKAAKDFLKVLWRLSR